MATEAVKVLTTEADRWCSLFMTHKGRQIQEIQECVTQWESNQIDTDEIYSGGGHITRYATPWIQRMYI